MRTGLITSLLLAAALLAGSLWQAHAVEELAARYESAAKELRIMVEDGAWQRAQETAQAYAEAWDEAQTGAQMIIHHDVCDAVTDALMLVRTGIEAQHAPLSLLGCTRLEEAARDLSRHNALILSNLL